MKVVINRYFTDAFLSALLASLLFLLGMSSLAAGPLFAYFAPGPLIWSTCRHGRTVGAAAVLLSTAFVLPFTPLPAALSFAVGSAFMGWLIGALLLRKTGLLTAALIAAAAALTLSFAASTFHLMAAGLEPGVFLKYQVNELFQKVQTALEDMTRGAPAGSGAYSLEAVIAFFRATLPSFLLITIFLQGAANGWTALLLLTRYRRSEWKLPEVASFALPDALIWVLIPSLALQWAPFHFLALASLNVLIVLLFLYLLQGLSIALHFMKRWNTGRPLRMIFLIFTLLQPYLLALPLTAGLLDFRFSWRSRWPLVKGDPPDGSSP